ncbi:MAG: murein DD-endopeptidase MepM/ murein hydrolase activator NlpD [Bradymonadia bacterium]|jgi:murein DD-endopeptidase MepM/ murein hydrolase activator NlpD
MTAPYAMRGLLHTPWWRRKKERRRAVILSLLVVAVVSWVLIRSGRATVGAGDSPDGTAQTVVQAVPTDRLLPLVAPEIRGRVALEDEGSGYDPISFEPARPSVPGYVNGAIQSGETLTGALVSRGVPAESLNRPVHALSQVFDFRRSQVGHEYEAELTSDGIVTLLRYRVSPEVVFESRRIEDGVYDGRQAEVTLDTRVETLTGTIDGSLIGSLVSAGEGEGLAVQLVRLFQWDIDFSRDVRHGDAFRLVFEKVYLEDEFLRYGNVLAAEYSGARASQEAYYFDDPEHSGYYTAEGEPLERMFLAAPCQYRRISSGFDPNRFHPVMQRVVPHNGVDFAANTGTPVYAAAAAEVTYVGFRGRAGNLVRLRHAHGYETVYAHLSRFARGLRRNDNVEQGQLIGYVGTTGMSTGPHLHFGMKLRSRWVDPLEHQGARGAALSGRALRDYQRHQSQLAAMLDQVLLADVVAEGSAEVPTPLEVDHMHMVLDEGGYDDDL